MAPRNERSSSPGQASLGNPVAHGETSNATSGAEPVTQGATNKGQDPNSLEGWWNQMSGRGSLNSSNVSSQAPPNQDPSSGGTPGDPHAADYGPLQDQSDEVKKAGTEAEEARVAAENSNQARSRRFLQRGADRMNDFRDDIVDTQSDVSQGLARFQGNVEDQFGRMGGMEEQFNRMMDQSSSFVQGLQQKALNNAKAGESGALQGAVQGIQGNVRNGMSQIDNNINLTPAQKTQMKSQLRVQGGLGMAPITGKIKADFQAQVNDINKTFGGMLSTLENTRGTVGGSMSTAIAQMGTQLTKMLGDSQAQHDTAQTALTGVRAQAELMQNNFELGMLPELDDPYIDMTGVEVTDYALDADIVGMISSEDMMRIGFDIQQQGLEDANVQSFFDVLMSGLQVFL